MRLSDLHPDDVQVVSEPKATEATQSSKPLKLSDFKPEDVQHVASAEEGPSGAEPSNMEALARGLGQGVTFGFGDELSGATGAVFDKLSGNDKSLLDLYHKYRDADRAKNEAARKAHPYISAAGNLVGSIPAAAITGGVGALAGVGELGTVGRLATQGAIDAGTAAAGASNADLTSGKLSDVGQFAADTAGGALAGAGTGVLMGAIAPTLSKKAEDFAAKHLRPTPKMSMALGKEGVRDAAREALDSGAIQFGAKADNTAANLENLLNETGAVKGDIVNASMATINPQDIAKRVDSEVISPLRQTAENQPIADSIATKKDAFLSQYPGESMTPAQLEAEKVAAQGNINYKTEADAPISAKRDYARVLKEGVENAIDDPTFKRAKDAYGNLASAQAMADRTGALTDGGGLMGHITDVGLGTEAVRELSYGNPAGIALGAGRALTKGRVSSSAAIGLDQLSKIIQTNPYAMGKFAPILKNAAVRGPAALASTHFIMSETNPEYRQQASEAAGSSGE